MPTAPGDDRGPTPSLLPPTESPLPAGGSAARSAVWTLSGSFGSALLILLRSIVVARLVSPSEFGRFALVATVLGVVEVASRPGLEMAAMQQRRLTGRTLSTLWSAMILRGCAVTALLLLLARPLATLLAAEDTAPLLMVIAFVPLIRSFTSMAVVAEAHRVNLGPQSRVLLVGQITETVVAIAGCAMTRSAFALAVALVVSAGAEVVASWCTRGFRPRFGLEAAELWPLMRVSRWVFGSNVLGYLSTGVDDLLVGRFSGTRALGLYRVAYRLGNVPTTQISHAVAQVALPFLSRLQDATDPRRREAFLRYLSLTSATAGIAAAVLAATATDLVAVLLGRDWSDAAAPLAILAVAGFVRAILACGGTVFLAAGRPQLDTAMQATRVLVLVLGLVVMLGRWGITGAALASLLSVLATVPLWARGLRRLGFSPVEVLAATARPLPATLGAGACAVAVGTLAGDPLPSLLLTGAAAVVSWLVLTSFQPAMRRELTAVVKHLRPLSSARAA